MADELSAPLARRKRKPLKLGLAEVSRLPLARIGFGMVALILVGVALRIFLVNEPEGGRPSVTVAINSTRDNNAVAGAVAAAPEPATLPKATITATLIRMVLRPMRNTADMVTTAKRTPKLLARA